MLASSVSDAARSMVAVIISKFGIFVFLIDLSTIYGLQQADIILQANDIIYVEPIGVTTRQVLSEISPVLGFVGSLITLYFVIQSLENN